MKKSFDEHSSDQELIELCQKGDEHAFNILYQRYRLPLFAYLHRLLPGRSELVDDVFQQVWMKAVANWQRYKDQQRLLAWLCRIAHNEVMDYFRREGNNKFVEIPENIAAEDENPAELLQTEELAEQLEAAINELPPEQQEIVRMRRQGRSFKDIADEKNLSLNTALGRMHYAVKKLREKLMQYR